MTASRVYLHKDRLISYEVKHTRRKTLGVYVYPDRRVQIRAPFRVKLNAIEQYVEQSADWILQQLDRCPDVFPASGLQFRDGEQHFFQGQAYTLVTGVGRPQRVELRGGVMYVYLPAGAGSDRVRAVVEDWYRVRAHELFQQRLLHWFELMREQYELPQPTMRVRRMRSQWGSCSRRHVITLSLDLVRYQLRCLDYVVVHELCHLREFNHSPAFYAMMERVMPNWRDFKRELEGK